MSITVVKEKATTVVTMVTDPKSMLPPLCQILKALCYSPVCCSVNTGLMQSPVTGGFGAVQIMVGLFTIGLGPGRTSMRPDDFTSLRAAYWLGAVYIAVGSVSGFANWFPSRFLVGFAVYMNIVGSIFAVVGIVLYAKDLEYSNFSWWCDANVHDDDCTFLANIAQRLLIGMDVTLIILTILQLCICIAITIMGFRLLLYRRKDVADVENYQPLLKEHLMTSPCA